MGTGLSRKHTTSARVVTPQNIKAKLFWLKMPNRGSIFTTKHDHREYLQPLGVFVQTKENNMVATFQSMKYILPNEYVQNEMFELGLTSFFQSAMEIRLCFISWLSYRYNDLHTLQQHDCCVT